MKKPRRGKRRGQGEEALDHNTAEQTSFPSRYDKPAPAMNADEVKKAATNREIVLHVLLCAQRWLTLGEIRSAAVKLGMHPDAEVRSRITDLREHAQGNWNVICERRDGAWRYRLHDGGYYAAGVQR